MSALLAHWPHLLPIALAFATVLYLWRADARYRQAAARGATPGAATQSRQTQSARRERAAAPVRLTTARRGAIVLGPIVAATATGAVIYGIDLAGRRPSASLAWTHAGLSVLLCVLAAYKLAGTDLARLRRELRADQIVRTGGSLLLAALLVPILATGVAVLASPSDASFAAYAHLIASAWWTLLVLAHLTRYLRRSLASLQDGRRDAATARHSRASTSTAGTATGQH